MLTIVWRGRAKCFLLPMTRELNRNGIYCDCIGNGVRIAAMGSTASYAIARFFVRDVLRETVCNVIDRFFPALDENESCYIADMVMELAQKRRMGENTEFLYKIAERIEDSVAGEIWDAEGFLIFRMQDVLRCYQDYLEDVICYMVSRGKYHQTVQRARRILLHNPCRCPQLTICRLAKGRYALYDERGQVISFNRRGEELLAAVIEAAPSRVVLQGCRELAHTACMEVLRSVFSNRITVVDN